MEVCEVVGSFLSLLTKYDENSQYVVPDVGFEIQEFDIDLYFIGCEQGVVIAKYL
jgi:hypothetical protein